LQNRLQDLEQRRGSHIFNLLLKDGTSVALALTTPQQFALLHRASAHSLAEHRNYNRDANDQQPVAPPLNDRDRRADQQYFLLKRTVSITPERNGLVGMAWGETQTHEEYLAWLHSKGAYKGLTEKELNFCRSLPRSEAFQGEDADYRAWLENRFAEFEEWRPR
jgi:hypothetical protein